MVERGQSWRWSLVKQRCYAHVVASRLHSCCDGLLRQVSINGRKGDVESELAVVAPIIEAARLAVGQIKSDHLNEIRSLKAPPDAIRDVLEGVLKLMGQADTSWNSMKKFLGNRGIKVLLATVTRMCSKVLTYVGVIVLMWYALRFPLPSSLG